ncbi:hypothetical protein PsorP6_008318 [Peronosclerospora sorghi]|uniref:Uncharacterized protein n=1 Tax=Peronosclerospora sorghi TaxID=230839 RepID=A0ACC0WA79_9STRA|nr:hypothetical protein PsorP6_008318 [Peronosclerospora sorghi]
MASSLVIALYRALLRSAQTFQRDVEAGRTLFDAIRSGAVSSYAGVKSDWRRERVLVHRIEDMAVLSGRNRNGRAFAAILHTAFTQPVKMDDKEAFNARIDAAFDALKRIDDQNALIQEFKNQGMFQIKERTTEVAFQVGDLVKVKGDKRGVIFAWRMVNDASKELAGAGVVYDILPHSPGYRLVAKGFPRDLSVTIKVLLVNYTTCHKMKFSSMSRQRYAMGFNIFPLSEAVVHPALILYFDGFDGVHHIASKSLAARYPSDDSRKLQDADVIVAAPSIIQLQCASEDKLLNYLHCDDSAIVHFALASLEGRWISEFGAITQNTVRQAVELAEQKKWDDARKMLKEIVQGFPEYAYAWNKLAMVEYKTGNFGNALEYYETAIKLKPQLIEALVGLGTCATRLRRWSIAHHAAIQLLKVQPSNEVAKMLIEQAVYATL